MDRYDPDDKEDEGAADENDNDMTAPTQRQMIPRMRWFSVAQGWCLRYYVTREEVSDHFPLSDLK